MSDTVLDACRAAGMEIEGGPETWRITNVRACRVEQKLAIAVEALRAAYDVFNVQHQHTNNDCWTCKHARMLRSALAKVEEKP